MSEQKETRFQTRLGFTRFEPGFVIVSNFSWTVCQTLDREILSTSWALTSAAPKQTDKMAQLA